MGNYCIVSGCGRNSRKYKQLNYYSLPKDRNRLMEWLKAAKRTDIIEKDSCNLGRLASYRLCSRHFPASSYKNKHLCPDAVPTLHLPGSNADTDDEGDLSHDDIVCDKCTNPVVGFRYKCVSCPNYDLCHDCEMLGTHPEHVMMRIPKPTKNIQIQNIIKKLKNVLNSDEMAIFDSKDDSAHSSDSSDDEPITKYASKNYDSGIDLSEDVKNTIRSEVARVLRLKQYPRKKSNKKDVVGREPPAKKMKVETELNVGSNQKFESVIYTSEVPEVAFADVNEVSDQATEMKSEYLPETVPTPGLSSSEPIEVPVIHQGDGLPTMHVKLSDDLSELMIEVTSNNQKTVYKYT